MGSIYSLVYEKSILEDVFDICSELNLPFRLPKMLSKIHKEELKDISEEVFKGYEILIQHANQKNVTLIDYLIEYPFHMQDGEDYNSFKAMIFDTIRDLKTGVSELFIHPSIDSEEIKHINPSWQKRVFEYRVFYEDDVQNVIKEEGIKLIPWEYLSK